MPQELTLHKAYNEKIRKDWEPQKHTSVHRYFSLCKMDETKWADLEEEIEKYIEHNKEELMPFLRKKVAEYDVELYIFYYTNKASKRNVGMGAAVFGSGHLIKTCYNKIDGKHMNVVKSMSRVIESWKK